MHDASDKQTARFVEIKAGIPVKVYFTTISDVKSAFDLYSKDATKAFEEIIKENVSKTKGSKKGKTTNCQNRKHSY